jgi:hypothetical protein
VAQVGRVAVVHDAFEHGQRNDAHDGTNLSAWAGASRLRP